MILLLINEKLKKEFKPQLDKDREDRIFKWFVKFVYGSLLFVLGIVFCKLFLH